MVKFIKIDDSANKQRLDNFLIKTLKGVPKSKIYNIIRKGEVRVNKGRKKPKYKLNINDEVRIPPINTSPKKDFFVNDNLKNLIKNAIIYEDNYLIAVNKPYGLAVHGGSGINLGLIEILRQIYNPNLELIHRLDRDTSGIILIAKKRSALKNLQQQIKEHNVKKTYLTLLSGVWAKKTHKVDAPLLKNIEKSGERVVVIDSKGKNSLTYFKPIQNFVNANIRASFAEVVIITGRTHQIRVHAKYANHPIAGDKKYGDDKFNSDLKKIGLNRLFLHAYKLEFIHPNTLKNTVLTAKLCDKLSKTLDNLTKIKRC